MRSALCLLVKTPNKIWIDFLNTFTEYDVFVVIDDNLLNYAEIYEGVKDHITFVQINNNYCYEKNYTHCNSAVGFPEIISWDKAIYCLNEIYTNYQHMWFIEDDVFLYSEKALLDIDQNPAYTNSDLLTATNDIMIHNDESKWNEWWNHWVNIHDKISLPWSHSMVCACRVSRNLLDKVIKYKQTRGHLFFIEAMFNTIALQNDLEIRCPSELSTIHWRTSWPVSEIDIKKLYHPLKNIEEHKYIRETL
jgi:hypothetical protein